MAKKPNSKPKKPVKQDESMVNAMKFFVVGFVAELYLMIIRRGYVNGTANQQIAWYDNHLKTLLFVGIAVLAVGAVLAYMWRQNKKTRVYGWIIAGFGAFVAASSALVHWNMSSLTMLSTLVPVVMAVGIVWSLYDRECALSLTALGVSLFAVWVCRHQVNSIYLGTLVKVAAIILIIALIAVAVLAKQGKLAKLLSAKADLTPVYTACGLSVVALAAALVSPVIAYYAMWALGIVVFGLAVYYTVKQL